MSFERQTMKPTRTILMQLETDIEMEKPVVQLRRNPPIEDKPLTWAIRVAFQS